MRLGVLLTFGFVLQASPAWAASSVLNYNAPEECPSASEVSALASRHSTKLVIGNNEAELELRIESGESQFHGTLSAANTDGFANVRELDGAKCRDVVEALIIVASMRADARVDEKALPQPVGVENAAATADESPKPIGADRSSFVSPKVHGALQLGAGLGFGALPSLARRVGAGFELRVDRSSFLSPSIRVAVGYQWSSPESFGVATARFERLTGEVDICPFAFGDTVAITPCARAEIGRLVAASGGFAGARDDSALWFAAGASLHAEWRFSRTFALHGSASAVLPTSRDRFYFEPNTQVFRTSAVAGHAELGLSWSIF